MKILLHAYYYDQDHQMGGAFTFQDEILKALKKNLHQTHHQFVGLEVDSQKYIEHPQIKNIMYRCSFWSRVKRSILWRLGKRQALFPNREVHEKLVAEGVEMIWGIVPAGLPTEDLPYILTVWDCQGRKQPYFPDMGDAKNWRQADGHYVGTFMRSAALMIGVPQGKKELNELYGIPLERIKVLPFPVPEYAKNFKAPDLATVLNSLDLPVDPFLFYPAQFAAHKNHVGLLKALVHLRDTENLKIQVVLVGSDKGNKSYIRKRINQWGLQDQVRVLHYVDRTQLLSLYQKAYALIYPSLFGPDNIPPLEACALGCPVVLADVPGTQEQLGEAGLFFDPLNFKDIAQKIKQIYTNSALREKLIQNGTQRANVWSADDYVKAVFKIFDEFEPVRQCWSPNQAYVPND